MRAHQPGSTPIDIPETVPNPAHTPAPAPAPERAPTKVPEKVPEKVIAPESSGRSSSFRLRHGASVPPAQSTFGLSAARAIAHSVGTQHSSARDAALFGDISDIARSGPNKTCRKEGAQGPPSALI